MRHIILIGFMGAGKTTVGRVLARDRGYAFFDTDRLIEEKTGMKVSRIFAEMGEETFRSLETEILGGDWTREENWILSVGGGLPLREENRTLLKAIGTVVYLRVRPETVIDRLRGDTSRPLLAGDHVKERVEELMAYRSPLYEKAADFAVDADGKRPKDIAKEILGRETAGKPEDAVHTMASHSAEKNG